MNIIVFEKQKINELHNLLQDIHRNMLAPAKEAFVSSAAAMDPKLSGSGNAEQLMQDISHELDAIEEAFFNNLSFLEILDDKYDVVENKNHMALEKLLAELTLYEGEAAAGEPFPDIAVEVNRTLRYLFDTLVQGYEEQVKSVSLRSYAPNRDEDYIISDASERNIISKYLTKLDFGFLSSLSDVYDFFDFGELNLMIVNYMRNTAKMNPVRLDEDSLKLSAESQQRRFPDLREIIPDQTDNDLRNMSVHVGNLAVKENMFNSLETAGSELAAGIADLRGVMNAEATDDAISDKSISVEQDSMANMAAFLGGMSTLAGSRTEKEDRDTAYDTSDTESEDPQDFYEEKENGIHTLKADASVNIEIDNEASTIRVTSKSDARPDDDIAFHNMATADNREAQRQEIASEADITYHNVSVVDYPKTAKQENTYDGDASALSKLAVDNREAQKQEIASEADTIQHNMPTVDKREAQRQEIASEADTIQHNTPTADNREAQRQEIASDSYIAHHNVSVADYPKTAKQEITYDGDASALNKLAADNREAQRQEIASEADNTDHNVSMADYPKTAKQEITYDGDTSLPNMVAADYRETQKHDISSDADTTLHNMSVTNNPEMIKQEIGSDGDNILRDMDTADDSGTEKSITAFSSSASLHTMSIAASLKSDKLDTISDSSLSERNSEATSIPTTKKLDDASDGDTGVHNIEILEKSDTEKSSLTSIGDTRLNTSAARTVTKKWDIGPEDGIALYDTEGAVKTITEKQDVDLSGDEIGGLNSLEVSGSTHFGRLNSLDESFRQFRAVNGLQFIKDETEDRTDSIEVNQAVSTARQTIKEDDESETIEMPYNPTGSKTITPTEFIEGVADQLQLMEVAIRKLLSWEQEEFYAFLDYLYSLAHSTEFPATPEMIIMVYTAIIDYILCKSFEKAEGNQPIKEGDEEELLNHQRQEYDEAEKAAVTANLTEPQSLEANSSISEKEIIWQKQSQIQDGLPYNTERIRNAAANILMDCVADTEIAWALAGMIFPEAFVTPSDIFANDDEIFRSSCGRFEALSGVTVSRSFNDINTPAPVSVYTDNARCALLGEVEQQAAAQAAMDTASASYAGVESSQCVTIHSAIPAFTTFERPSMSQSAQQAESANNKAIVYKPRTARTAESRSDQDSLLKNYDGDIHSTTNTPQRNTAEDFVVEYSNNDNDLSEYLIDTAGSSTLGFLGGLMLSGEEDLEDKFCRISKLPVHTLEEVIKNAYQSGVIMQAKQLADKGDIFHILSGGKATVTTLDNVGSCLMGY